MVTNELMKAEVRKLWDCCFNDNPEFTDLYFSKRYTDKRNIAIEKENKVISALQLLPYPITFYKSILQSWYISGAATYPEYRNQGVMKELIRKSFYRMQQNDIPLSTLIPADDWLFNYYEKSGFATVFYSATQITKKSDFIHPPSNTYKIKLQTEYNKEIQHYLDKKLKEKKSAILHPKKDLEVVLADLSLVNGFIITLEKKDKIVGLAIVWRKEDRAYINELLTDSKEIERELFYYLFSKNVSEIHNIQASNQKEGKPLGMLRIINVKQILDIYAAANPEISLQFNLTDPLLEENNGFYDLRNGTCNINSIQKDANHKTLTELTKELFIPLNPHMSLMLN